MIGILNSELRLSYREEQLLEYLMRLDEQWKPNFEGQAKSILTRDSRKELMKELTLNKHNLSMYLRKLKEKKLVIEHVKDHWIVNPAHMPSVYENEVHIMYVLKVEDEKQN